MMPQNSPTEELIHIILEENNGSMDAQKLLIEVEKRLPAYIKSTHWRFHFYRCTNRYEGHACNRSPYDCHLEPRDVK